MNKDAPWYETIVFPALLRWGRETYGNAMRKALAEVDCDDIPPNGLFVIGGLGIGMGDYPLGMLAKDLKLSKQAASQLVDTLVLRGYVKREADEEDRRRFSIRLTERGWHASAALREAREKVDAEFAERAGAENVAAARKALGVLVEMGGENAKP
jgi:DNA-binding MarR family transcriptional regulator